MYKSLCYGQGWIYTFEKWGMFLLQRYQKDGVFLFRCLIIAEGNSAAKQSHAMGV